MAEEILEEQEQTVEEQYYTYEISENDSYKYTVLLGEIPSIEGAPVYMLYTEMCDRFSREFKFAACSQNWITANISEYVDENAFREDVQKALVLLDEYYNKLISWQPESEEQPIFQESSEYAEESEVQGDPTERSYLLTEQEMEKINSIKAYINNKEKMFKQGLFYNFIYDAAENIGVQVRIEEPVKIVYDRGFVGIPEEEFEEKLQELRTLLDKYYEKSTEVVEEYIEEEVKFEEPIWENQEPDAE